MYQIKDWDATFENYRSRERKDALRWVQIPTKQDAQAFRILMSSKTGAAAYGVFIALVQIAAKMPVRGVLADDKGPLSLKSLAVRIGHPESLVKEAIDVLASPEIGWVLCTGAPPPVDHPSTTREAPVDHRVSTEITFPSLPSVPPGISPSARFVANRSLAAGNAPPGFLRVVAAFPKHRAGRRIVAAALVAWEAAGLESETESVLAGIVACQAGADWTDGAVPNLDNFIVDRGWERPAPPKPVKSGGGGMPW